MADDKNSSFVKNKRDNLDSFIANAQYLPSKGARRDAENMIEQRKILLKKIEDSSKELSKLFRIEDYVSTTQEDIPTTQEDSYPKSIRNYHTIMSVILGALILGSISIGLSFLFGGGNSEAWSTSLKFITLGIGVLPAVPATFISSRLYKKNFNKDATKNKKGFSLDKFLLNRSIAKEASRSQVSTNIFSKYDAIVNGKHEVTKEEINSLPFHTRTKTRKILSEMKKDRKSLRKLEKSLHKLKESLATHEETYGKRNTKVETSVQLEAVPDSTTAENKSSMTVANKPATVANKPATVVNKPATVVNKPATVVNKPAAASAKKLVG